MCCLSRPATLRDGTWRVQASLPARRRTVSYDEIADGSYAYPARSTHGRRRRGTQPAQPDTLRAEALRNCVRERRQSSLCWSTATPVNNSLWDLYYLLAYFLKSRLRVRRARHPVAPRHFAAAMALNPDDLSPEHLFDILDAVSVRRTRPFVKRGIRPTGSLSTGSRFRSRSRSRARLRLSTTSMKTLPASSTASRSRWAAKTDQTDADRIERQRTTAVRCLPSPATSLRAIGAAAEAEPFEVQVAGLSRSGLSSGSSRPRMRSAALAAKMVGSTMTSLACSTQGLLRPVRRWRLGATDSDDLDELEAFFDRTGPTSKPASSTTVEALRADVEHDRDVLLAPSPRRSQVRHEEDPKLAVLSEELARSQNRPTRRDRRRRHARQTQGARVHLLRGHGRLDR